jgi:inner membrane protein
MDSLTHIVLGAAVGEAVLGRKVGNKAMLWGAFAASVPDFDVAITSLFNPVDALFVHRGFSHSLVFAIVIAPILGYIISKIHKEPKEVGFRQWTFLSLVAILSHSLIDCFNTYGTELLAPFSNARLALDSIGIIDFTLLFTLIILVITILFFKQNYAVRRGLAFGAILFTILFTTLTIGNKLYIENRITSQLKGNEIEYTRIKTSPLPATNFLWLILVEDSTGYYYGYRSTFDKEETKLTYIKRNRELLGEFENNTMVKNLIRFTAGFYAVNKDENNSLLLYDLRFGSMAFNEENWFVFTFEISGNNQNPVISRSHPNRSFNLQNFKNYFERL